MQRIEAQGIEINQEFTDIASAFTTYLNESVFAALNKQYSPPMSLPEAVKDYFYEDKKFSWKSSSELTVAIVIGSVAAAFNITPSKDAAILIVNTINEATGLNIGITAVLTAMMQAAALTESGSTAIFAVKRMIAAYLHKMTEAEKFLMHHDATRYEKFKTSGRNTFNFFSAIAADISIFLLTRSAGLPFALTTTIASFSLMWFGVSQVFLPPNRKHPAQIAEAAYFNGQIDTFLNLPLEKQNETLDKLHSQFQASNLDYKKLYATLLNLSESALNQANTDNEINIQDTYHSSSKEKIGSVIGATTGLTCQSAFITYTGLGVANLFEKPTSTAALMSALPVVLLSLLPSIGYGYNGGKDAGKAIFSDQTNLAELYKPRLRRGLQWLNNFVSFFSSGSAISSAHQVGNAFTDICKMAEPISQVIKWTYATTAAIGYDISTNYYVSLLLDEILIYFAMRCGDEQIKRLFNFVLQSRKLALLIENMPKDNYLLLLKQKLTPSEDFSRNLSDLLYSIFDNRLNEKEYIRLKNDLANKNFILKKRTDLPHYKLIPNFFREKREGLRKRSCFCHERDEVELEMIEIREENNLAPMIKRRN